MTDKCLQPKLDLRSHSMFSTIFNGRVNESTARNENHRDHVRLRVMSRQLNNTHLSERHVGIKSERQLLDKRRETFLSFANVGIECPLLHSPTPRIYGARRRRVKARDPDVLTISWDVSGQADNSPFVDEGPDDNAVPEWSVVLASHHRLKYPIAHSKSERGTRDHKHDPKLQLHKSVTWAQTHPNGDDEEDEWQKFLSPAYQRHRRRYHTKRPSKPPFERYAIGSLSKSPSLSQHPNSDVKVGIHLHAPSREVTLAQTPNDRRLRGELHPVTTGLRQFGTAPEQIRWRQVQPGEMKVRKVWDREVSEFRNPPLMQMAREDTQHLENFDYVV